MEKIKQKILTQEFFIILLIVSPFLGSQWVVGPLVNAILFSSVFFLGTKKTVLLAFIPSLIALSSGLMPVYFLVPIIGFSNLLLIFIFDRYKNHLFKAIVIASIGKASFLFLIIFIFPVWAYIFGLIQLVTALLGGLIFLGGKKYLN